MKCYSYHALAFRVKIKNLSDIITLEKFKKGRIQEIIRTTDWIYRI